MANVQDGDGVGMDDKHDAVVPHDEMAHVLAQGYRFRRLVTSVGKGLERLGLLQELPSPPGGSFRSVFGAVSVGLVELVFGVLLGHVFLGERETRYRLAGALIVAGGSVLIAAAG